MRIFFAKKFKKRYKKLNPEMRVKVSQVIAMFRNHPFEPRLHNHRLKGKICNRNSIRVTNDIRIIFEQEDNYTRVLFLQIGTHNQVYKN